MPAHGHNHWGMFDLIWHLRGSVALDRMGSNEVALDRVESWLEEQRKGEIERSSDFIAFDDPLWSNIFGPNWLALVIYDRGRFWIEQGLDGRTLHYDLRSLRGMVWCLFLALMAFLAGLPHDGLTGGAKLAAVVFAWLYGMNIVLALVRVPWAIRKAVTA